MGGAGGWSDWVEDNDYVESLPADHFHSHYEVKTLPECKDKEVSSIKRS